MLELPVSRETAIANSQLDFSCNVIHVFSAISRKFVIVWQALYSVSLLRLRLLNWLNLGTNVCFLQPNLDADLVACLAEDQRCLIAPTLARDRWMAHPRCCAVQQRSLFEWCFNRINMVAREHKVLRNGGQLRISKADGVHSPLKCGVVLHYRSM